MGAGCSVACLEVALVDTPVTFSEGEGPVARRVFVETKAAKEARSQVMPPGKTPRLFASNGQGPPGIKVCAKWQSSSVTGDGTGLSLKGNRQVVTPGG